MAQQVLKAMEKTMDFDNRRSHSMANYSETNVDEVFDEYDQSQYNMLGNNTTVFGSLAAYLSHPKFFTSLYNINGRQIYSSKCTIISGLFFIFAINVILVFYVYPMLTEQYISINFERMQLSNSISMVRNETQTSFFEDYILRRDRVKTSGIPAINYGNLLRSF